MRGKDTEYGIGLPLTPHRFFATEVAGGTLVRNGDFVHTLPENRERNPLHVEWENSPAEIANFKPNTILLSDGRRNPYPIDILWIERVVDGRLVREPVMSNVEYEWAERTMDAAFDALELPPPDPNYPDEEEPISVADFGIGLRLTANRSFEKLRARRSRIGEIHAVDLNKGVMSKVGIPWRKRKYDELKRLDREVPGRKSDIRIELYQGDAGEWAQEFLRRKMKFHILISDTYPLIPEEAGYNDLNNLDIMVQLLDPHGVFAFFPYKPGVVERNAQGLLEGRPMAEQIVRLHKYFHDIRFGSAPQNPPREYPYAWVEDNGILKPVRQLPVVIATKPKLLRVA